MAEFRMPSLGADMEAGTLVEWMVKPGDRVKRGDVVAVVETQKGAIEIEIFEAGQVERILVDVGGKVPVGTPLAHIRSEHEIKAGVAEAPRAPEALAPVAATVTPGVRAPPPKPQLAVPPRGAGPSQDVARSTTAGIGAWRRSERHHRHRSRWRDRLC